MMPATIGADTEVPVWPSVQRCRRSVVTCERGAAAPKILPARALPQQTSTLSPIYQGKHDIPEQKPEQNPLQAKGKA